jgi:hypothetical protein
MDRLEKQVGTIEVLINDKAKLHDRVEALMA